MLDWVLNAYRNGTEKYTVRLKLVVRAIVSGSAGDSPT